MDMSAITKLPPKRLAMIVAGGVGAGLLWRHFSSRKAAASGGVDASTVDTSKLALAQNSAGNLGTAQSQQVPSTNDAIRDVGQGTIPLPVSKWVVIGADGIPYYADASGLIGPVSKSNPATVGGPPASGEAGAVAPVTVAPTPAAGYPAIAPNRRAIIRTIPTQPPPVAPAPAWIQAYNADGTPYWIVP